MKRLLVLLLFVGLAAKAPRAATADVLDRVIAVANGDVILLSDVRAAQRLSLVEAAVAAGGDRTIVAALIDRALMLDEVNRYAPPEPQADAVAAAVQSVRARFASADAYTKVLAEVGLSEAQLTELLRQNLRIRAYLAQRFVADAPGRADAAIAEWLAGLRRRASIIDRSAQP